MQLFIADLRIDARIGVHHHERGHTQPLSVDVTVDIAAPRSDRLSDTLDYDAIKDAVLAVAAQGHHELVETFAAQVVERIMADDRVAGLSLRVAKLEAMAGFAHSAGVKVEACRV